MNNALLKLHNQVEYLAQQAEQFDNAKWFAKNRYIQAQPSLFDRTVFATKSLQLTDYVDEIKVTLTALPEPQKRHAYAFALEKIATQIEAVIKVLKSTSVWAKENKVRYPKKTTPYRNTVKKMIQSSQELYQELSQNHEFERRLLEMVELRKVQLNSATPAQATSLNQEILTLHARLGRCRKAISAAEEKIQLAEKQQTR
ncbi:primosomal replication protein N'' [Pseudoalteromonas citrea]|uniref:Primosomal replication protein N n=3 Tax=Pseudoalteromonas citrea TaxID=43655 RepID=A0AAD4FTS2_9GAMM|nr:primosomal replication protein N'' [Pseudoalteromonas citrea]